MQKILSLILVLLVTISISASELKWHSFEEAYDIAQKENKIILIDFYTDWCGWCKKMDQSTYTNKKIINTINEDFVVVKINPEEDGYIQTPNGKIEYRRLSNEIGVTGFPSVGFFTKDFEFIDVVAGYQDPTNMSTLLSFMKDGLYDKLSFQDYRLFNEVKKMSHAKTVSPKVNYVLGYFYMVFFKDNAKAFKNFETALNSNLKNKEIYAALSYTDKSPNSWLDKAKELGYKDKAELDELAVNYVRQLFQD